MVEQTPLMVVQTPLGVVQTPLGVEQTPLVSCKRLSGSIKDLFDSCNHASTPQPSTPKPRNGDAHCRYSLSVINRDLVRFVPAALLDRPSKV